MTEPTLLIYERTKTGIVFLAISSFFDIDGKRRWKGVVVSRGVSVCVLETS